MDKYDLTKMGFQAEFVPVVDRNLKLTAHEAILLLEDNNPHQEDFQFQGLIQMREAQANIDHHFKQLAIKAYKGNVPLILPTIQGVNDPFPDSLSVPKDYELILTVNQPEFWFNGKVMGHYNQLSAREVKFALAGFGQDFLSLPFLMKLRPKLIKLAADVIHSCKDDEVLRTVANLMKPYKVMGVKILVDGIDSREQYERMSLVADAFQGSWTTRIGGEPIILLD